MIIHGRISSFLGFESNILNLRQLCNMQRSWANLLCTWTGHFWTKQVFVSSAKHLRFVAWVCFFGHGPNSFWHL